MSATYSAMVLASPAPAMPISGKPYIPKISARSRNILVTARMTVSTTMKTGRAIPV